MRDYIFRGKRLETGEWIESRSITRYGESSFWLFGDDGLHEVDMETVGQYTGLTDKNGKMIMDRYIVSLFSKLLHPSKEVRDYILDIFRNPYEWTTKLLEGKNEKDT